MKVGILGWSANSEKHLAVLNIVDSLRLKKLTLQMRTGLGNKQTAVWLQVGQKLNLPLHNDFLDIWVKI